MSIRIQLIAGSRASRVYAVRGVVPPDKAKLQLFLSAMALRNAPAMRKDASRAI
jgi:hypothetical protein